MSSAYRETVVPQIYNRYKRMLGKSTMKGLPDNPAGVYAGLSSVQLKSLGICEYLLNNDVVKLKNYFYNSVVAASRVLELYDAENDLEVTMGVSMMNFWSLYQGLISGNMDATIKFAELMGGRDKMEVEATSNHVYNLGYALKYLVLGDKESAKKYIDEIEKNSSNAYNLGLFEILDGIIRKDKDSVEVGISKRLKYHKKSKEFKKSPEEFLSLEIIALVKLARINGLDINIDEDVAPMEIISTTNVDYELIKIMTF